MYDTTNVNIQIPEYTHTDTQINISANTDKEPADGAAKWNVLFEGKPIENIAEHIDGSLDGNDNTVILKKAAAIHLNMKLPTQQTAVLRIVKR